MRRLITRRLLGRKDTLRTGVSAAVQQHWCRTLGWSTESVTVVHNGIDLSAFPLTDRATPDNAPFRIGFAGRLAEMKGVQHLVEAVFSLRSDECNVTASIAGDGPLRSELETQVAASEHRSAITFLGQISDVGRFFSEVDALVLPSLDTEGLPLVLLEAMATGLPCVATDVGGSAEAVVDGMTGWVVPRGETPPLAAAIRRLAEDRTQAIQMGRAGRERAETQFSRERMAADYVSLFRKHRLIPERDDCGASS